LVGVAVVEASCPVSQDSNDLAVDEDSSDRRIPAAETFADGQDVWDHVFLLEGEEGACPADAAHDLVEDEEDAVSITDLADCFKVSRRRGCAA